MGVDMSTNTRLSIKKILLVLSLLFTASVDAADVEVLHWWTANGEVESIDVLKGMLEEQGHSWRDFAVAGGGGDSAMTVLKTRAVSGNPPSAAQIKGRDIQEWAGLGFLTNLNDVAKQGQWDDVLPPVVSEIMKWHGQYVAVPVNIHRVNWLWVNLALLDKFGLKVPTSLDEFFAAGDILKAAGFIPLAHGGQPWQDATLFEVIALDVLGPKGYQQAFVNLDMDVLSSDKMVEVFRKFQKMHDYIDVNAPGRDWNVATSMVIGGQAAMQIMGDWAKGEFTAAGKVAGKDYLCVAAPGTEGQFIHNIDSFAFYELSDTENKQAQQALATTILAPQFQEIFNLKKGSIPVRVDVDMSKFDLCALDSMNAFKNTAASAGLVPSMAHGMSTTSYVQSAMFDVVTDFFNDSNANPKQAARKLAKAVRAAM